MIYFDTLTIINSNEMLPLGTTDIIKFFICKFSYLIKISKFDILVIFTNIWPVRKGSKFYCRNEKSPFLCTPGNPLQKLLLPFFDQITLIFGLSERDGLTLDQRAGRWCGGQEGCACLKCSTVL